MQERFPLDKGMKTPNKNEESTSEHRKFNNKENASSSGKIHDCQYCGKTFKTKQGLLYHPMEHEGKFKYKCIYCNKGYNIKSGYDYHMSKHEGKGFCCLKCKKTFRLEFALKKHSCPN